MTRQVKVIGAPVKESGDFGAIFPNAIVAFYHVFKNSQEYLGAEEGETEYSKVDNFIESITYKANYWPNAETRQAEYRSRPIKNENTEDESEPYVFKVDITKPQYKQILESHGDAWELALRVIELHYKTEVAVM